MEATIIYILIFFAIIYFLLIRPQQKQQKQRRKMLDELQVNDDIVTVGGIHGKIVKLNEDDLALKVGEGEKFELKLDRNCVGYVKGEK